MKNIVLFKNNNLNKEIILDNVDWSRKQNKNFSTLHGISSYLAMFSPAMPSYFIQKYSKINDLIMDNFSGRGTTALVARELNRKFIGNDLNPYAYVLTRFKTSTLDKSRIINLIKKMENEFYNSKYKNFEFENYLNNEEMLIYYHENTLKQLLFLRENYEKNWKNVSDEINAILALSLGLMHGPVKKNKTSIYFSVSMPNTISMSPKYVKKYAFKNKLEKPNINIFEQILNRLNNKYDKILEQKFEGKIYLYDSTKKNSYIKNNSVDLVITSPPYLSIVNYTTSNWLKLWLLGYERKFLKEEIKLSDKLEMNKYIVFIKEYLNAIYPKLKNKAKICLVVGDVFETKLIEKVWESISNDVSYKFVEIYYDYKYSQTHKTTNMLNLKSGKATKIDKVLVIEKYEN